MQHTRKGIHYWKCDRPAAFHGLSGTRVRDGAEAAAQTCQLTRVLERLCPGEDVVLRPGNGQGNHLTFSGNIGEKRVFVRVEDGPDSDDYMDVESAIIRRVGEVGVPVPRVYFSDASRRELSFAWQVLAEIPAPDLNQHFKSGTLQTSAVAYEIGRNVARWQQIQLPGFGPFDSQRQRDDGTLRGYHPLYADYYFLRLEEHLAFLVREQFFSAARAQEVRELVHRYRSLLAATRGVLVHKDLALWNILGKPDEVVAFIDWDDAISGDPSDDLSLLACFHDRAFINAALSGYADTAPLPAEFNVRFWLHLLRNMITKSVIRVGAGYFRRDQSFFLVPAAASGKNLETVTREKLAVAYDGLISGADPRTFL